MLQKPDLTAADGVSVTGAGGFPGQFFGTSAAAPNAAAIAALIKSANPGIHAGAVQEPRCSATALDIEAPGVDRDSGAGIVMASRAADRAARSPWRLQRRVPPSGGPGTFPVGSSAGTCNWVVWSTVPWITVTATAWGPDLRRLVYAVSTNLGPARSGTIMIQGGQIITVTQAGTAGTTFDNNTPLCIPDNTTVESSLAVSG